MTFFSLILGFVLQIYLCFFFNYRILILFFYHAFYFIFLYQWVESAKPWFVGCFFSNFSSQECKIGKIICFGINKFANAGLKSGLKVQNMLWRFGIYKNFV